MSRVQQERERQKALLLRQIQQQRLDLNASRRPASISSYCPIRFALLLAALITLPLRRYITLSIHFVYQ